MASVVSKTFQSDPLDYSVYFSIISSLERALYIHIKYLLYIYIYIYIYIYLYKLPYKDYSTKGIQSFIQRK